MFEFDLIWFDFLGEPLGFDLRSMQGQERGLYPVFGQVVQNCLPRHVRF